MEDHLRPLIEAGGYYECPVSAAGNRLGPLVGYAGKYLFGPEQIEKRFVGEIYVNFAKLEQFPELLDDCAIDLAKQLPNGALFNVVLAAPMGGIFLASATGFHSNTRTIFAEKEIIALATSASREQSRLQFKRHELREADRAVIVEDVCNNFSTTEELVSLVEANGGLVTGIACFLNRSGKKFYERQESKAKIPVFALVDRPLQQWRQEDQAVAADIAKGNIVWKPKSEWPRLMEAMQNNQTKPKQG